MKKERNIKGAAFDLRFGSTETRGDAYGIRFFGSSFAEFTETVMREVGAKTPEEAGMSDHQVVKIWFRFEELKPYSMIRSLFDGLAFALNLAGWTIVPGSDSGSEPKFGSSIDCLVDTSEPRFCGKPEESFPRNPQVDGCNAASGFTLVIEKLGTKPEFSEEDIEGIKFIVADCSFAAHECMLPEVDLGGFFKKFL